LSCKMCGPSPSKWGRYLCIFCAIVHPVMIARCCHSCSTWKSIRLDDSSVIISKDHHLHGLWLRSSKFFGRGEVGLLHSFDYDFKSSSKTLTHVSSIATVWYRKACPSTLNLCFGKFPGVSVSVQQSNSEGSIGHKIVFSANLLSKYGILMLLKSR